MAQIEDIFWTHKVSAEISLATIPAYFVRDTEEIDPTKSMVVFFAIVRLTEAFREQHQRQWSRLTKDELVDVHFGGEDGCVFQGRLMDRPHTIRCLGDKHAFTKGFENDLVVRFKTEATDSSIPLFKTYGSRAEAEEAIVVGSPSDEHATPDEIG
jgi:hypothetical protein